MAKRAPRRFGEALFGERRPPGEGDPAAGQDRLPGPGLLAPPRVLPELALVAIAGLVQVGGTTMAARNQPEYGSLGVGAILLLALGVLALPLRHRFPVGVLAFTFGTTLTYWSFDFARGPVFVSLVVALIHVVLIGRRGAAIASLVAGFVAFPWLGYMLDNAERPSWHALVALAAWLVVLMGVGEAVRSRRDRVREAARSAAEASRRQVADERLRIARDIHDAVAHNMSLISVQAGVALHLLDEARTANEVGDDDAPEQVRQALDVIKGASKEALVELRSILGVLRQVDETDETVRTDELAETDAGGGVGADVAAPRAPVPDLQRLQMLDDVVARASSTGLDVKLELGVDRETLQTLPHPVGLAAFRIVQESLTNVVRHSDSATAVVRIGIPDDGVLAVEILDEGSGSHGPPSRPPTSRARDPVASIIERRVSRADPGGRAVGVGERDRAAYRAGGSSLDLPGGGSGIVGMRERAAAVGGRLEAGPRPGRGFAVRARLPLETHPLDDKHGDSA